MISTFARRRNDEVRAPQAANYIFYRISPLTCTTVRLTASLRNLVLLSLSRYIQSFNEITNKQLRTQV